MQEPSKDPGGHLRVFWRQRGPVIGGVLVLCFWASILVAYLATPRYAATCKLQVEPGRQAGTLPVPDFADNTRLDTHLELLQSRPVVEGALRMVGLQGVAPAYIYEAFRRDALAVAPIKGTNLVQITVQDADPVRAFRLADALANVYVEENLRSNREPASQSVAFIAARLGEVRAELAAAEERLKVFRVSQQSVSLPDETHALIQQASQLEAGLQQDKLALQEAQQRASALRAQLKISPRDTAALDQDPRIARLRSELAKAQTGPAAAALAERSRAAVLRQQLEQLVAGQLKERLSGARVAAPDPVRQALSQDLIKAEIDRLALEGRIEAATLLTTELGRRLAVLPGKETAAVRLLRDAEVRGEVYKMLLKKYEEARLAEGTSYGTIRIVEPAEVPLEPSGPGMVAILCYGLLAGLALGGGLAVALELFDDRVRTAAEARAWLADFPLLGIVPWARPCGERRARGLLYTLGAPQSPAAEAVRMVRQRLCTLGEERRAFGFTSSTPGEGRTTLLANLAVALTQSGRSVALVDVDLRHPTLHTLFAAENKVGLTTVLGGRATLDEATVPVAASGLYLLPAGPLPPGPSELLESSRMELVIQQLRMCFDYVLVDTPPIGLVADATIVGSYLDGLFHFVGVGVVSRKWLAAAVEQLAAARTPVLGVVIRQGRREAGPGTYPARPPRAAHPVTPSQPPRPAPRSQPARPGRRGKKGTRSLPSDTQPRP